MHIIMQSYIPRMSLGNIVHLGICLLHPYPLGHIQDLARQSRNR